MAKHDDNKPAQSAHKVPEPAARVPVQPVNPNTTQEQPVVIKPYAPQQAEQRVPPTPPAQIIDSGPSFPVVEPPGRIGANIVGHHENRKDDWAPVEPGGPARSDEVIRRPGDPAPRYEARYPEREYEVVDQPFYDGVQLHEVGARIRWAGPPSNALHPLDGGPRASTTNAPVFPDPLKGRGDANKDDDRPSKRGPAIVTQ